MKRWNTENMTRAAWHFHLNLISHAQCEGESPKFQTSSLSEINNVTPPQFCIARNQQHRPQIREPQEHNKRDRQIEIGVVPYYGFDSPTPDSTILPPPKWPRRAGDLENFQPPPESIIESVQQIAENQPEETNISPQIVETSPPASRNSSLHKIDTLTLVHSMTALEAERHDSDENEWENWNCNSSKQCQLKHFIFYYYLFLAMITSKYIVIIYTFENCT